jgi:hypothetical protein
MRASRLTTYFTLAGVLLLAGACDSTSGEPGLTQQPITSAQASASASANLGALASGWTEASDWVETAAFATEVDKAMGGGEEVPVDPNDPTVVEGSMGIADMLQGLADFLEDEVMTADQVESEDGKTVVYLMNPEKMCTSTDEYTSTEPALPGDPPVDPAPPEPVIDQDCVQQFTDVPIRVKVVSYAAGEVDVTLLVGTAKIEVGTLAIHADAISATVDLARLKAAVELLFGDQAEAPFALTQASGKVRLTLERTGPKATRITAEVLQAISVSGTVEGLPFSGSLGASKVTVDMDGETSLIAVDASSGALDASLAYQLFANMMASTADCAGAPVPGRGTDPSLPADSVDCGASEPATVSGTLTVAVPATKASFSLEEATQTLALSLGGFASAPTVKLDGATVFSALLNGGGPLAVAVHQDGDDLVAEVTPQLNAVATLNLAPLAAVLPDVTGSWMEAETLTARLDGAATPTVAFTSAGLKVVAGALSLESASHPELNLSVAAGQCVVAEGGMSTEPVPAGNGTDPPPAVEPVDEPAAHPFESLSAGECVAPEPGAEPTPVPTEPSPAS